MYLEPQVVRMSHEWGPELLKSKNETTTDVFRGENATKDVRVIFLEVEMRKVTSRSCI